MSSFMKFNTCIDLCSHHNNQDTGKNSVMLPFCIHTLPQPLATSDLFFIMIILVLLCFCFFFEIVINGIVQYVTFWDRLLSLPMPLRAIQAAMCTTVHVFLLLRGIMWDGCSTVCLNIWVAKWHMGCFQFYFGYCEESQTINIHIEVLLWT